MTIAAVIVLSILVGLCGYTLTRLHSRLHDTRGDDPERALTRKINSILPGIQCGQCGYPGCEPYARALAQGLAGIDRCAPGGNDLVAELARVLGQEPVAVRVPGQAPALKASVVHRIARVRMADCIGCTLCLDACPVDAIVGAPGHLHTVAPDRCTGCQLCLPPCPTDCIEMVQPEPRVREWEWPWADPGREPPQPR